MIELSCFVACAFGKDDVDLIYDRAIKPVLAELGISSNRVDMIEHNDDIDDKIIELINTCDVCIADLSYSRPSVYFEAGYFIGLKKPVIFTVRKDHFTPKENDIHGIERIHFDLQMKNIIPWSSTEHVKTFSKNLKSRLNYVSKPLIDRKTAEQKEADSEKIFKGMSQKQRLDLLSHNIQTQLKKNSWEPITYDLSTDFAPKGYLSFKKQDKIVCVFITNSATKEYLKFVEHKRILRQHRSIKKSLQECHILIVSLRQVPQYRIDDVYPENQLFREQTNSYFGGEEDKTKCFYHIISNIQSEYAFSMTIEKVMDSIYGA